MHAHRDMHTNTHANVHAYTHIHTQIHTYTRIHLKIANKHGRYLAPDCGMSAPMTSPPQPPPAVIAGPPSGSVSAGLFLTCLLTSERRLHADTR